MKPLLIYLLAFVGHVWCYRYHNETVPDPASLQLEEFRRLHPKPIGVMTRVSGEPMDVRDINTLNTDIFMNRNHFRLTSHNVRERIPERITHAKGVAAHGYFEVTHDVSKYIKSDVFNGIGKRTPAVARFSVAIQNLGGSDLVRETKSLALKLYTKEGNLDLIGLHLPIFHFKDPILFQPLLHALARNPRTHLFDQTMRWDFINLVPSVMQTFLWLSSDSGLADGYEAVDYFPQHTYEVYNKHGDRYFVKFNFRSENGYANLTSAQAKAIASSDFDYFNRKLYNAIAQKNYPVWTLEMDILTMDDLMKVSYDPFDMTRLWKRGTYHTVTVGRLVFNRRVDNHFAVADQSAYSPDTLVPGIKGPFDPIFRARKLFYPDAQNYRLGVNHDNIRVNAPLYKKVYSRDGKAPPLNNMRDAPNYFPNSFNGPMPFVDEARSSDNLVVYHHNAIDLQPLNEFYHEIVESDAHRQRIAERLAASLRPVPYEVEKTTLKLMGLVSKELQRRVSASLAEIRARSVAQTRERIAQCIANVNRNSGRQHSNMYDRYVNMFYH